MTSPSSPVLCYDADGNLTSQRSAGTCASGTATQTPTWDQSNRLTQFQSAVANTSYVYDPFGRRIRKVTGATTTYYLWDGDQLLAEYNGSGTRQVRYAYADGFAPAQVAYGAAGSEAIYVNAGALLFQSESPANVTTFDQGE